MLGMAHALAWQSRSLGVQGTALWLSVLWLSACTGGQSGSEGSSPAPPCAAGRALFVGRIHEVSGGCVSIEVERVVAAGPLSLANGGTVDGNSATGAVLRGRLSTIYSYRHEFMAAESVAVLIDAWDEPARFELFPLVGDRVQVQWGPQRLEVELEEMAAPDCAERLEARRTPQSGGGVNASGSTPTSPPLPEPVCTP
jgi:hypothetical protein